MDVEDIVHYNMTLGIIFLSNLKIISDKPSRQLVCFYRRDAMAYVTNSVFLLALATKRFISFFNKDTEPFSKFFVYKSLFSLLRLYYPETLLFLIFPFVTFSSNAFCFLILFYLLLLSDFI